MGLNKRGQWPNFHKKKNKTENTIQSLTAIHLQHKNIQNYSYTCQQFVYIYQLFVDICQLFVDTCQLTLLHSVNKQLLHDSYFSCTCLFLNWLLITSYFKVASQPQEDSILGPLRYAIAVKNWCLHITLLYILPLW